MCALRAQDETLLAASSTSLLVWRQSGAKGYELVLEESLTQVIANTINRPGLERVELVDMVLANARMLVLARATDDDSTE